MTIGRWMMTIGAILLGVGLAWELVGKKIPLGRLPGDIHVQREGFQFSFPIVTCLLVSAALSLVMYAIRYFRR